MSIYIGCFLPGKGVSKKPEFSNYSRSIEAPNKKVAGAMLTTQFYTDMPDIAGDYLDVKVCEDRVGISRPAPTHWDTTFNWNKETGEIELITQEPEEPKEPEFADISKSPTGIRAALLALYGRLVNITWAEHSLAIDLTIDTESSPARELHEAITKVPAVLALLPERQAELIEAVRAGVKETAQWPAYKAFIDKWLDTPPEKRTAPISSGGNISLIDAARQKAADEKLRTPSGAIAGGQNQSDRGVGFVMTHDILALEVALGLVGRSMDFDIYNLSSGVVNRAREIINTKEKPFPQWFESWRSIPGGLDYSRAITIYSVKCAPNDLEIRPGALIGYLTQLLTETDHEHPASEIVAAACGIKSELITQNESVSEDETKQNTQNTANVLGNEGAANGELEQNTGDDGQPAEEVKPGRSTFTLEEILAGPDAPLDERPAMSDREIEIAHALNDLLSGRTTVMDKADVEGVVACTGHLIPDVFPRLIADITETEFSLAPDFSDDEIHDVSTSILDSWSDDRNVRVQVALDAIVEYRAPLTEECKKQNTSTTESVQKVESVNQSILTYHQQLTLAALQGLCANTANAREEGADIACKAIEIVCEVIRFEGYARERGDV